MIPYYTSKIIFAFTNKVPLEVFHQHITAYAAFALGFAVFAAGRGALFSVINNKLSRALRCAHACSQQLLVAAAIRSCKGLPGHCQPCLQMCGHVAGLALSYQIACDSSGLSYRMPLLSAAHACDEAIAASFVVLLLAGIACLACCCGSLPPSMTHR